MNNPSLFLHFSKTSRENNKEYANAASWHDASTRDDAVTWHADAPSIWDDATHASWYVDIIIKTLCDANAKLGCFYLPVFNLSCFLLAKDYGLTYSRDLNSFVFTTNS